MRRFATVVLLSVLVLTSCPAVDWRELNFTRSEPKRTDIVGTWTPDQESVEDIRDTGGYENIHPEIVFRADGKFFIRDMPDWWSDVSGQSHGSVTTLDGTWSLEAMKAVWEVWSIKLETRRGLQWVHLYRQKPPFALFLGVGDPNNAHAMIFERTEP